MKYQIDTYEKTIILYDGGEISELDSVIQKLKHREDFEEWVILPFEGEANIPTIQFEDYPDDHDGYVYISDPDLGSVTVSNTGEFEEPEEAIGAPYAESKL